LKTEYDTTNNGIVDNTEKLGGKLPAEFVLASEKGVAGGVALFDEVASSLAEIPNQTYITNKALNTDNARSTTSKTVTGAINELFTNANNLKSDWAGVVGSPLLNTDTSAQLKTKTQTLKTTMASNLTAKGKSSVGTEDLTSLIDKIGQIVTETSLIVGSTSTLVQKTSTVTTSSTSPTKLKEYLIKMGGVFTVQLVIYNNDSPDAVYGQIYVNGVARGILRSTTTSTKTIYSQNITLNKNDLLQFYGYTTSVIRTCWLYVEAVAVSNSNFVTENL